MPNRLAQETSPYLRQHCDNPVEWYPWGAEALEIARREDKPILLSIGYSACHWCHVMAHESFEDPQTAALMNELYINIKVDREERPDLDQIYQTAHAMLTRRSGGWPLTMFLTPEQEPFFGGTYFPKDARHGLPSFGDVLARVARAYRDNKEALREQGERLREALESTSPTAPSEDLSLTHSPVAAALNQLRVRFDPLDGGFGEAPKFPHVPELDFCLQRSAREDDKKLRHIAAYSLTKMTEGGLFDQLGGGYCRYSVDAQWDIPHFEKMLYDNGPLLALLSDAWRATSSEVFANAARMTAQWVLREMQSAEGGYYSSLDADSEHEEGKFYVWTREAVRALLSEDDYAVTARLYGLDQAPNFEHAQWHLRVAQPITQIAADLKLDPSEIDDRLERAKQILFNARERRVRPSLDQKILTSWNALMIAGMARAGRVFGEEEWITSSQRALNFVRKTLWRDNRLLATYKDGRARFNAYLDDYAFLLFAVLEMLQTKFDAKDLMLAQSLADALLDHFEDRENGGFYFTSHDHETLIHRPKGSHDNATPSGNGIAAQALLTLGHLLGETRYIDAAERTLRAFHAQLESYPSAMCSLLRALELYLAPPTTVVLRGPYEGCREWQRRAQQRYWSHAIVLNVAEAKNLPGPLEKPLSTTTQAWVCRGTQCLAPIVHWDRLVDELSAADRSRQPSLN